MEEEGEEVRAGDETIRLLQSIEVGMIRGIVAWASMCLLVLSSPFRF